MFSLDSCKLPLPSLPNTKPSSDCKKNNRLDWSHPTRPTIKLQNFPFLPTLLGFVGSGLETNKVYFHTLDTYMSWTGVKLILLELCWNWASWYLYLWENGTELSFNWSLLIPSISLWTKLPPPLSLLQPESSYPAWLCALAWMNPWWIHVGTNWIGVGTNQALRCINSSQRSIAHALQKAWH